MAISIKNIRKNIANAARKVKSGVKASATHVGNNLGAYTGAGTALGSALWITDMLNKRRQASAAPATVYPTSPRPSSTPTAPTATAETPTAETYPTLPSTEVPVESGTLTPAQKARTAEKAKKEADKKAAELANNPYKNSNKLVGDEAKYPRQIGPTGGMGARQFDDYLNAQLANPNSSLSQGLLQMRAQANAQRNAMMRRPNENADEWNGRMIGMGQMRPEHAGIPDMSLWNRDAWANDSDAYENESLNRTGVFDTRMLNRIRNNESYAALQAKSLAQSRELGSYPDRASLEHAKRLAALRAGRNAGSNQMGPSEFMTDADAFDLNSLLDGNAPWDTPAEPRRSSNRLMPWRDFEIGR